MHWYHESDFEGTTLRPARGGMTPEEYARLHARFQDW
ncbi:hypothetical protein J2S66_002752 [Saccharothrix longispora]|uniref:Uncharacterized protein n=1 Tax=Saccharothrix longispora TaxID=33920 RepID=A0ABU1PUN7_9PSEU|nr:hypothetical protein [Saccharothrix longispora]